MKYTLITEILSLAAIILQITTTWGERKNGQKPCNERGLRHSRDIAIM